MTIAELTRGQRVRWRGELVTVVSVRGEKAKILRPGVGLRWAHIAELEAL